VKEPREGASSAAALRTSGPRQRLARLAASYVQGVGSADGTVLATTRNRLAAMLRTLHVLSIQPLLPSCV
jgi:hypothetical protein